MKNTSHITRYTQQKNKPRVTLSSKSQTPALSSIRWRRGLGRGGAFLLVSPLLGPLPTRSSRGEDGELDAALGKRPSAFALLANAFGVALWWPRPAPPSSRHPAFCSKTGPLLILKQALKPLA